MESKRQLLELWLRRLREIQASQYDTAKSLSIMNLMLGIPVVILTTFVGTSVFASLQKEISISFKIIVGVISVTAAVLASLQTFLRFSERAENHRVAGSKAGILRREIEQILTSTDLENLPDEPITRIRQKYDDLTSNAPNVSNRIWNRTERKLGMRKKNNDSNIKL
jgi:hypothetical protein